MEIALNPRKTPAKPAPPITKAPRKARKSGIKGKIDEKHETSIGLITDKMIALAFFKNTEGTYWECTSCLANVDLNPKEVGYRNFAQHVIHNHRDYEQRIKDAYQQEIGKISQSLSSCDSNAPTLRQ